MNKTFMFNLVIGLSLVAAAVLWILSIAAPDNFGWFNLNWAVAIFAGTTGVVFILRGTLVKMRDVVVKKFFVWLGAGLLAVAAFSAGGLIFGDEFVAPIIALILACGLVIGMIAVGGRRWDEGDNQRAGYKNYYQRKAEEEERKAKEAAKIVSENTDKADNE